MIHRSTHLDPFGLRLVQHAIEYVGFNTKRDVQIERLLSLEIKWLARDLEERKTRSVIHLEETVKTACRMRSILP